MICQLMLGYFNQKSFFISNYIVVNWIKMTRKYGEHSCNIQKHWTAVSTLLGLISSVYCYLPHWRLNQRPQKAEPKLYHCAISPHPVFARFSGHGNSIHNIIPLLKKENVHQVSFFNNNKHLLTCTITIMHLFTTLCHGWMWHMVNFKVE